MPIRTDRKDVLIFERRCEGIVIDSHHIDIEWRESIENGESYVTFQYQYNVLKHPWIFNTKKVCQAIAQVFEIAESNVTADLMSKVNVKDEITIRIKIPIKVVNQFFMVETLESKPIETLKSPLIQNSINRPLDSSLTGEQIETILKNRESARRCVIL